LGCGKDDLINEAEMLELIENAKKRAGNPTRLARDLGLKSASPLALALLGERAVSDGIALYFGYECVRMFRRIGNATRA
jgi:hypothetical protein